MRYQELNNLSGIKEAPRFEPSFRKNGGRKEGRKNSMKRRIGNCQKDILKELVPFLGATRIMFCFITQW